MLVGKQQGVLCDTLACAQRLVRDRRVRHGQTAKKGSDEGMASAGQQASGLMGCVPRGKGGGLGSSREGP